MEPVKVLFVCLGNICRSPMAEGLFIQQVAQAGLGQLISVDSAGTSSHHEGELADYRMRQTAQQHGISLTTTSRPIVRRDFQQFDYILTMDRSVHRDVQQMQAIGPRPNDKATVMLMRDFDREDVGHDVPDPYYGGPDGFEEVFRILDRSCAVLLDHIRAEKGL
jgi:protein-tyrosine phosphatase